MNKLKNIIWRLGDWADILGWLLIAWPIFFLVYQEFIIEGPGKLTLLELLAYGAPIFSLPILGALIKRLFVYHQDLEAAKNHLEGIIRSLGDILLITNRNGRIILGNPLLEKYFGQVIGRTCQEVVGWEEGDLCRLPEASPKDPAPVVRRHWILVDGEKKWFDVNISPFLDDKGDVLGAIQLWRDVTRQVELEERLKAQAVTDSLTKLKNSHSLFQSLPHEIQRARRQGYPLSLAMMDLDRFKRYNDQFGHLAGDRVLQRLGRIILDLIRKDVDAGYRYGGDEFIVLLPYLDKAQAVKVLERIAESLRQESFPLVSLSIGLLVVEEDLGLKDILDRADKAMYAAKNAGGGRIYVHGD